jgi:hypothetical protein
MISISEGAVEKLEGAKGKKKQNPFRVFIKGVG